MITDRNGNVLKDGDIVCINPDDDEWYDAVLDMGDGLELASFDPELAHIRCKLADVTDSCDKVLKPEPWMYEEVITRLAYDTLDDNE